MPTPAQRAKTNKRNGAEWERNLRTGLRSKGEDCEALRLSGREDEGDMVLRGPVLAPDFLVIEAKAAIMDVGTFVREALVEAEHFAKHRSLERDRVTGIAVVKRPRMRWQDAYVLTTLGELMKGVK